MAEKAEIHSFTNLAGSMVHSTRQHNDDRSRVNSFLARDDRGNEFLVSKRTICSVTKTLQSVLHDADRAREIVVC